MLGVFVDSFLAPGWALAAVVVTHLVLFAGTWILLRLPVSSTRRRSRVFAAGLGVLVFACIAGSVVVLRPFWFEYSLVLVGIFALGMLVAVFLARAASVAFEKFRHPFQQAVLAATLTTVALYVGVLVVLNRGT